MSHDRYDQPMYGSIDLLAAVIDKVTLEPAYEIWDLGEKIIDIQGMVKSIELGTVNQDIIAEAKVEPFLTIFHLYQATGLYHEVEFPEQYRTYTTELKKRGIELVDEVIIYQREQAHVTFFRRHGWRLVVDRWIQS